MPNSDASGGRVRKLSRLTLFGVTFALIAAAIYLSTLIAAQQGDRDAAARPQLTWMITQASVDVARLQATIGNDAIESTDASRAQVQLWLDIVAHRSTLLHEGEAWQFIKSDPEMVDAIDRLRDAAAAAQPLVAQLDAPGTRRHLIQMFQQLNRGLGRLSSTAFQRNTDLKSDEVAKLNRLHWMFSSVLSMLIASSLVMVWFVTSDNRLLKSVSAKMQLLVLELRRAGSELSAANHTLTDRDRELREHNAHFDAALTNMSQALCMVNSAQELIVCNVRFREMFDLEADAVRPGRTFGQVTESIEAAGSFSHASFEVFCAEQQALIHTRQSGSFSHEDANGRALSVVLQVMPDLGWVATFEEVTERRRAEARISYLAHHDALTGLPNRVTFRERLDLLLARLRSGESGFAVLCLDLDHFKAVNDTLGHPAGDRLLELVASRLQNCVRDDDLVARLGGDEFAVLQQSDNAQQAGALAERIIQLLGQPYELYGQRAVISVSVGIATSTSVTVEPDQVFQDADTALYDAKSQGRACYSHFDPVMNAKLQLRRETETDLREALALGQIEAYYQPIVDAGTAAQLGFEALLRWHHPRRGMISPGEFIPVAEDLAIIGELGQWILNRACEDAQSWPAPLRVSVNLSPLQFKDKDVAAVVARALALSGLAPDRLELEVTESVLMLESESIVATLHEIRRMGVHITLDDFGTGYSSLSYLRSFPFEKVKIDQSFVRMMDLRPDCRTIVNAISSLARELGMRTTAEGVETQSQLDLVRSAGCNEIQGYLYSRPMPARDVAGYLSAEQPHRGMKLQAA